MDHVGVEERNVEPKEDRQWKGNLGIFIPQRHRIRYRLFHPSRLNFVEEWRAWRRVSS